MRMATEEDLKRDARRKNWVFNSAFLIQGVSIMSDRRQPLRAQHKGSRRTTGKAAW